MRLACLLIAVAGCNPLGPLEVTAIEPAIGSPAGGEQISILGNGLSDSTTVTIGGVPCTGVTADSQDRATCTTGSHDYIEGVGDVVVGNGDTTITLPAAFEFRCPWKTSAGRRSCGAAPAPAVVAQEVSSWITQFEPGHGFVADGNSELEDHSDFVLGSTSAWVETDGNGVARSLHRAGMGPIDMRGQQIKVWLKVDRVDAASAIEVRLASAGGAFVFRLDSSQGQQWMTDGDWVAYTVSWAPDNYSVVGAPDRGAITEVTFRVVDDRSNRVRLHVNGLALVPEPVDRFPTGALSFTFDDGWDTMMIGAADLARHAFPATAYIIVEYVGNPDHVTLRDLHGLQDLGWDVAAHAFTGQHHDARYPWLAPGVVEDDIVDSRAWLMENRFRGYHHCAYPGGDFDLSGHDILPIAARFFSSCRTIYQRQREAAPPSDPLKLRVFYVTDAVTLTAAKLAVDQAAANREWIILVFHQLVDRAPSTRTEWNAADFRALVDHVASSGIAVVPVAQLLAD